MESQPNIEQLIADAAARGKQAQDEEEAKIAAALAESDRLADEDAAQRRAAWIATLDALPQWVSPYLDVHLPTFEITGTWARLDLPGCVPVLIDTARKLKVADYFEIECPDDYVVSWRYGDPYELNQFDMAIYEARQAYPAWQAAHAECDRLNAQSPVTETLAEVLDAATASPGTPTTVDTAADLLKQFINGDTLIKYEYVESQIKMVCADDRAVVLAAPLIAIAQAVTRIADALEARHG